MRPTRGVGGARIVVVLAALRFAYRVVDVVRDQFARRAGASPQGMDDHLVSLVRRLLKIVVVALAFAVVPQMFGVNVGSVIAGLGVGGRAVALGICLAAKGHDQQRVSEDLRARHEILLDICSSLAISTWPLAPTRTLHMASDVAAEVHELESLRTNAPGPRIMNAPAPPT